MIIVIITNFAIIFSSTLLFYWIFSVYKNSQKFTPFQQHLQSVAIGIGFGLISLIISILFLDIANNVFVNTRFITFLVSGLLGGPVAMVTNILCIFSIRFILGYETLLSLIVSINALVVGGILSIIAIYKPITLKTAHYYLAMILVEKIFLLMTINDLATDVIGNITLFTIYSIALYAFLIFVIKYLNAVNRYARKSIALKRIDYLTQLPNNLALETKLQDYIDQQIPFEMIHLDIDLYKNFNMQYGYRQGDQLLSQLAQTIRVFAEEKGAYVGRIGGDEFCYVIRDSNPASAIVEVYELCQVVENTIYTIDDDQIQVTMSGSIISFPDNATTLNEIYTASNYALRMITESETNTIKHINQLKQEHPNY